jgi:hypothetical protein
MEFLTDPAGSLLIEDLITLAAVLVFAGRKWALARS